jgi:hypothetical protein
MRFAKFAGDNQITFRWDYDGMENELAADTAQYYQDAIKFALENGKPEPEIGGAVDRTIRMVLGPPPLSPALPRACSLGEPWMLGKTGAPVHTILKAILEQGSAASSKEALEYIRASMTRATAGRDLMESVPVVETAVAPTKTIHDVALDEHLTYREFARQCKGKGLSSAEIALLWREHQANMAAV